MNCPTDWGVIITVVACLFAILGVMIGLFLYLANKIDGVQTSLRNEVVGIRADLENIKKEIFNEARDFHGRLCAIEERNRSPKTNP